MTMIIITEVKIVFCVYLCSSKNLILGEVVNDADENDDHNENDNEPSNVLENEEITPLEHMERKWNNEERHNVIDDSIYNENEDICYEAFTSCDTGTKVFLKLMEKSLADISFQSNLYATQKDKTLNMTSAELMTFIGINFLMGYHQLPSISDYWSSDADLGVPLIQKAMARNRFQLILSLLHVNDNSLLTNENKDKLYKVRPFMENLNQAFSSLYYGTRQLSVDESMIRFKGRSSIKQYNPMKPIKRGYKLWCLADQHGFVKKLTYIKVNIKKSPNT